MLAGVPLGVWAGFLVFVAAMLALDLGVFHRKAHVISVREALIWTVVWIGLALVFNLGILLFWDQVKTGSAYAPPDAALAFLTGYVVEKALSVDNIFVFLVLFRYFTVPEELQHRVLFWGILGAIVLRAIFVAAGAVLLERFEWMVVVFGAFLIFTGIRMAAQHDKEMDPGQNRFLRLIKRVLPVTPDYVGNKFMVREAGRWLATPLLVCLVMVELTDLVFAVDSIPAVFAVTRDPFLVFTSNIFAILGLRALFFALAGLMGMFRFLGQSLAAVLTFVGGKMVFTFWQHAIGNEAFKVPVGVSLGVIVALLGAGVAASWLFPKSPDVEGRAEVPVPREA